MRRNDNHTCDQECGCGSWSDAHHPRGHLTHAPPHAEQVGPGGPGRKLGRVNLDVIEENWEEYR